MNSICSSPLSFQHLQLQPASPEIHSTGPTLVGSITFCKKCNHRQRHIRTGFEKIISIHFPTKKSFKITHIPSGYFVEADCAGLHNIELDQKAGTMRLVHYDDPHEHKQVFSYGKKNKHPRMIK